MAMPAPLDPPETRGRYVRLERFLRKYMWYLVLASVIWTALNYTALSDVPERVGHLVPLVAVGLVGEVFFIGGLVMIAVSLGRHVFAGTTFIELLFIGGLALAVGSIAWYALGNRAMSQLWTSGEVLLLGLLMMVASGVVHLLTPAQRPPWQWAKTLLKLRRDRTILLNHMATNRLFRRGFTANWIGAILGISGLPLLVAIFWVLPPSSWFLAVIPVVDIMLSCSFRIAIRPRPTVELP